MIRFFQNQLTTYLICKYTFGFQRCFIQFDILVRDDIHTKTMNVERKTNYTNL